MITFTSYMPTYVPTHTYVPSTHNKLGAENKHHALSAAYRALHNADGAKEEEGYGILGEE